MSRVFDALQQSVGSPSSWPSEPALEAAAPGPVPPVDIVDIDSFGLDEVPRFPTVMSGGQRLVALTDERSLGAEKIRVLSSRLTLLQQRRALKSLLVTSTMRNEGKSVVAANLAITLAKRSRQRTLLIDADVRQHSVENLFEVGGIPGLADWWRTGDTFAKYLRRAEGFPLWLFSAGTPPEQPLEMLQSQRLSDLLTEVSRLFDWVIIDSPPLAPLADSSILANLVDGVLFIVRAGSTAKNPLTKALQSIEKSKNVGIVINCSNDGAHHQYHQYYPTRDGVKPAKQSAD